MSRRAQAFLYGTIITLYLMGFYVAFGALDVLIHDGDAGKFLADTIIVGLICFGFSCWGCYEIAGWFEKANKPRDRSDQDPLDPSKKDATDSDHRHPPGSPPVM